MQARRLTLLPISAVTKRHYGCIKHCREESACDYLVLIMTREFKPVRLFVLMGLAAFTVHGVAASNTHLAARGGTLKEEAVWKQA